MEFEIRIRESKKVIRKRILDIEIVPYKVVKIAQYVEQKATKVKNLNNDYEQLNEDMARVRAERADNWRDEYRKLKADYKEIEEEIMSINDSGFFDERFEAIELILKSNGIKDDDELMNIDFWEKKIDYSYPMSLITFAINKDIKKLQAARS